MEGGFKHSPLRLNEGLGELDKWDEEAIRNRAARLADKAVMVWKGLPMAQDKSPTHFRDSENRKQAYTIEDHPQLAEGSSTRNLFESFRNEVLAIDPCVSEEFLKHYVAYKAETNFVDCIPQARRLNLTLNMVFHDLLDPRGMARDVANIGRWGNGEVEVGLAESKDLPYIMGLVRQAYERQMADEGAQ